MTFWGSTRKSNGNRTAPLEEAIKPYREVIVGTRTPPPLEHLEIREWADLVRVSDTLGKPILRFSPGPTDGGHVFYIRDGSTTYLYDYDFRAPQGGPSAGPSGGIVPPSAAGPASNVDRGGCPRRGGNWAGVQVGR